MQAAPVAIIRFSDRPFIDEFVRGRLYMNTLAHFARIEQNDARRDSREGLEYWLQPEQAQLSIRINGESQALSGLAGPIKITANHNLDANVFCMYALRFNGVKIPVDPENLKFGDTFAIPIDVPEFLKRVAAAAQDRGFTLAWNPVEYVDPATHHGQMGIFKKFIAFSYQSEFRLAILPGAGKPYKLEVGDLSDLMITGPASKLNDRIAVRQTDDDLVVEITGVPDRQSARV